MAKPLRVLVIEDDERDADILLRELRRSYDVTWERVETASGLTESLDRQEWDVIISDYSMPRFSAPAALTIVKERELDIPFIIMSGTIGEETAVAAMRAGAHDFMTKDKFARLRPAIERELHEVAGRVERRKMRDQLLISDRMASVGTLAAGVAHEINNPLSALIANLDFMSEDLGRLVEDARSRAGENAPADAATDSGWVAWLSARVEHTLESLADIMEASERVRFIVRDLSTFSRSGGEQRGPVDVHQVVESSLRMAGNEIRHRAALVKDYGDVQPVEGNEDRLGQVFLNLIVNAAQAIPEGKADQNEIRISTRVDEAGRVVVEVRDTGSGMPEAVLDRVFDPFYTTKLEGVGTGLGLAICHRIVTSFGGEITVESQEGKGTTFRIALRAAKTGEVAEAVDPDPTPDPVVPGRRGRILVIDDEPTVASAIRRSLAAEHDVVTAGSAREAADRVGQGERFDLILCDLMMPEMTGMEVHAELEATAPQQAERMVFMTGGAFTPQAQQFLSDVPNPRFEKPFDVPGLRALVKRLLR